jgi:hypothetical protein
VEFSLTGPITDVDRMINAKHAQYVAKARLYAASYYTTRLLAGLSACLLPFVVGYSKTWATALAIVVAVTTVFDQVFSPKDRWVLFSKATDMIALARIKATGDYDKYKDVLDVILQTETGNLQQLMGLQELVDSVKKQAPLNKQ